MSRERLSRSWGEQRAGHIVEEKEREPLRHEVGLFLFESKSRGDLNLPPDRDWTPEEKKSLQFTNLCLTGKRNTHGVYSVSCILGPVKEGESFQDAAIEVALETTHVRPTGVSGIPLETKIESGEASTDSVKTVFRTARVLPGEVGYSLDPEHHPVDRFVNLDYAQAQSLFTEGHSTHIVRDETIELSLGDIFLQDGEPNKALQTEVLCHLRFTEALKKLAVLRELIPRKKPLGGISLEIVQELQDDMQRTVTHMKNSEKKGASVYFSSAYTSLLDVAQKVEFMWQRVVVNRTGEQICAALEQSNLRAILTYSTHEEFDMKTGKGVPTMDLLFPLLTHLQTGEVRFSKSELHILSTNPEMKRLLRIAGILHNAPPDASVDAILKKLGCETSGPEKLVLFPHREALLDAARAVDSFIERLTVEAGLEKNPLDQSSILKTPKKFSRSESEGFSVRDAEENHIRELVAIALGKTSVGNTIEESSRIRWEAKRKLILMYMFEQVEHAQKTVLDRGIYRINDTEQAAFSFTASSTDEVRASLPDRGSVRFGDVSVTIARFGGIKALPSLLRKTISNDQGPPSEENRETTSILRDTFRETYILELPEGDEGTEDLLSIVRVGDGIEIPRIVETIFKKLIDAGIRLDRSITITNVKPPPKPSGRFDSTSPGGGDPIRMMKFDIVDQEDGAVREVQLFLPQPRLSPEGTFDGWKERTGYADFHDKKRMDEGYGIERLFRTKSFRPFMEAIFPAAIYGRDVHKLSVVRREKKKKKS